MSELGEPVSDEQPVPRDAVLIGEQHRFTVRAHARSQARRLQLHERHQRVHLGLLGCERGQDAPEPHGVVAELRPGPGLARRRRVALIEHRVDDLEHRGEPRCALGAPGQLERHLGLRERSLGAHDSLRDRRLGHEESARDLVGREPSEHAQGERHPRLTREHRVAGDEDQAQEIVTDVLAGHLLEVPHGTRLLAENVDVFLLGSPPPSSSQLVEPAVARGRQQPRAGPVGDPLGGPVLERGDERLLGEILRQSHIADEADERRDQPRRLHLPDRLHRAMRLRHGEGFSARPPPCAARPPSRGARPSGPPARSRPG